MNASLKSWRDILVFYSMAVIQNFEGQPLDKTLIYPSADFKDMLSSEKKINKLLKNLFK